MNEERPETVAIIYTGELRTIEKVYMNFKGLLKDDNYHIYAVLQNEDKDIEEKLKMAYGNNLKFFSWFNNMDATYWSLKEYMVNNINICDDWKIYLFLSGSMIEYYQMYQAYMAIVKNEQLMGKKYDYIMRIRCDCIITRELDMNRIFNKSKEELYNIYNEIQIEDENIRKNMLFNCLIDNNRWRYVNKEIYNNMEELKTFDDIYKYYKKGKFMIALRENIFYMMKRKYFYSIASLGVTYGTYIDFENKYWFNAESQLKSCCLLNEIDYYTSNSEKEGLSLYNYNNNNYFDENGILKNQKDVIFFLVRN
jgi:hypothetical protein